MTAIKKIIIALSVAIPALASAWTVPDETLHYAVRFKWGFIDANVGIATVATRNIPGEKFFEATLSGKSVNLLGHYYAASDTIVGSIMPAEIQPVDHETIATEQGQFAIETITSDTSGPSSHGPVIERLPDRKVIRSRVSDYGSGLTIDLLSVFYYMRQVNYADYNPGQSFTIDLSNASQMENLNITYVGKDSAGVNGTSAETYHITLTFSAQDSSACDSIEAWISTDETRTPLVIDGSLSIGHMECRFINADINS